MAAGVTAGYGMLAAASVANGAMGAFANAQSARQSFENQKKLMKYQAKINYKYGRMSAENQYSWQRTGLENAGYNPMLAYQGAEGVANTGWTSPQTAPDPKLGEGYAQGISNALNVAQQYNSNKLTEAQTENYNADSVLKTNQSLTEAYTQLEKLSHSDLMEAEKVLADKNSSYREKEIAWYDKKTSEEIIRMQTQNKVDLANSISNQITANASLTNAQANASDVASKNKQRELQNESYGLDNVFKYMRNTDYKSPLLRTIYMTPGFHTPYK